MAEPIPEPALRSLIGDAVHHAVSKLFEPSIIHIAPINTIAGFLLQHLFRRVYLPVCGSVRVTGGGEAFGLDADPADIEAHEYYLWLECEHEDGRAELVDFGTRYWADWARGMGVLWMGEAPPPFLWAWEDEVAPEWAQYTAHPEITSRAQEAVGRAIAQRTPDSPVETWEKAVNDAVDYIAGDPRGLAFLAQAGLAEPIEEPPPA